MIETFSDEDKLLVRYLFGELEENEARELEDEVLLNDELAERVEVVEMNLIDHYVRNELSGAERVRFEEKFLVDPENRDKVERARMFQESLASDKRAVVQPINSRSPRHMLSVLFARPLPAFALVALVVLLLAALIVFEMRRRAPNTNSLTTNSATPATSPNAATPSPTNVPSNEAGAELAKNDPQQETHYEYIHRQDWNGSERGGAVIQLTIRPHTKYLELAYELDDDEAAARESYGITIKNQYGERVWPEDKPKAQIKPVPGKGGKRKLIVVKVPVSVFSDGGPYLFEIDDQYLPAKQFSVKR